MFAIIREHDSYAWSANTTKSGIVFTDVGLSERHAVDYITFEIVGKITGSGSGVGIDSEQDRNDLLDSLISNVQLTDAKGTIVNNLSASDIHRMARLLGEKGSTWDLDPGFSDYPVTGTNEYNIRAQLHIPLSILCNPLLRTAFSPQIHQFDATFLNFTMGDGSWTDSNSVVWTVDSGTTVKVLTQGRDEQGFRLSHPIRFDKRLTPDFDGCKASIPGLQLAVALDSGSAAVQDYNSRSDGRNVETRLDGRVTGPSFADATPFRLATLYDSYGPDLRYELEAAGYGIQKGNTIPLVCVRRAMTSGELAALAAPARGAICKLDSGWTGTKTFLSAVVRSDDYAGAGTPLVPSAIPGSGPIANALAPFYPTALDR